MWISGERNKNKKKRASTVVLFPLRFLPVFLSIVINWLDPGDMSKKTTKLMSKCRIFVSDIRS